MPGWPGEPSSSSLALDGRLHWDEPTYLYVGAFIPYDAIIEGDFQPSGIEGHYLSRLLHVLLIHALTQVTGPGAAALTAIISIYLALLLASAWISYLVMVELLPGADRLMRAVLLAMFTPIYLYLAFKTMPEIPAFFLSALAALALLRSLRGRAPLWLLVSTCALAAAASFKNNNGTCVDLGRHGFGYCRIIRSAGIACSSRLVAPAICFMWKATPEARHWSRMLRAQSGSKRRMRERGPDSPPAITQSMPARSRSSGPSNGSKVTFPARQRSSIPAAFASPRKHRGPSLEARCKREGRKKGAAEATLSILPADRERGHAHRHDQRQQRARPARWPQWRRQLPKMRIVST